MPFWKRDQSLHFRHCLRLKVRWESQRVCVQKSTISCFGKQKLLCELTPDKQNKTFLVRGNLVFFYILFFFRLWSTFLGLKLQIKKNIQELCIHLCSSFDSGVFKFNIEKGMGMGQKSHCIVTHTNMDEAGIIYYDIDNGLTSYIKHSVHMLCMHAYTARNSHSWRRNDDTNHMTPGKCASHMAHAQIVNVYVCGVVSAYLREYLFGAFNLFPVSECFVVWYM